MVWQETAQTLDASGDWPQTRAEFEVFVERYQDPLVRYAFRRLGRIQDAEDAVQEVFVRIYVQVMAGQQIARGLAYLYRMTANVCTDVLRRRKRLTQLNHRLETEQERGAEGNVANEALYRDELQQIEQLVQTLPRRQAEALRLRMWDGLRFEEIAEVLGCPLTTAKSRFHYGLRKLQQLLPNSREDLA